MADLCQDINRVFLQLAGALMEHSLEGIAPLRHTKALTEYFLQENVP